MDTMNTSAAPVATAPPVAPGLTEAQRLGNVFVAPSRTFTDLRRNARWIVPFFIMILVSMSYAFTIDRKVGFDQVMRNTMRLSPKQLDRIEKLPPDQKEQALQRTAAIFKYSSYIAPVFILLFLSIMAGVLMAIFNFGLGAEVSFKQALAVMFYAGLVGTIKTLLAVIVMNLPGYDPEGFMIENPVFTNAGHLLDPVASPAMYKLASGLDIFAIWTIILVGIAYSCLSKVKRGTAIAVVAGAYVFYIVCSSLIALAGS